MRSMLSPAFTCSKMKAMFILINSSAKKCTSYYLEQNNDIIDFECKDAFSRYCNDVIASAVFGVEVDSLRHPKNEFYKYGREATNLNGLKLTIKTLLMMLSPKLCDYLNITFFSNKVRQFFIGIVQETIQIREQKEIVRPDVIQLLLQLRNESSEEHNDSLIIDEGFSVVKEYITNNGNRKQITNNDIASQAMIFFFAGFDTASTVMCFMCYELATNPDVQNKLRKEVEATVSEFDGDLTYEGLQKMKYMDMFVSETLRKWPVITVMDRICTKPYTIEPKDENEKPLHLNVGDIVWLPAYAIHHDEKYYKNPEKFDPERFNEENRRNINLNAYLPFGMGPRNCIGSRFALMENKAMMFHLLRNFEIIVTDKSLIPLRITKNNIHLMHENGFWYALKKLRKQETVNS